MTSYINILHINEVLVSYMKDKEGQESHKEKNDNNPENVVVSVWENHYDGERKQKVIGET